MNHAAQAFDGDNGESLARLDALRAMLASLGLDAVFLTSPQAIFYYSGFASTGYYLPHGLLIAGRDVVLVARDFERGPALSEARLTGLHCWTNAKPFGAALAEAFAAVSSGRPISCGYEARGNFAPATVLDALKAVGNVTPEPLGAQVDRLRAVKSTAEIALSRQAGAAAITAMQAGLAGVKTGAVEIDVAAGMMTALVRAGSDVPASFPYAYFGSRSFCRMQPPSRQAIQAGDTFYLEAGASRARYGAAILRTGILGEPDPELVRAYAAAREAFEAMERSLVPGATSGKIDAVATTVLAGHGLAEARLLKAGYSIGIGFAPGWGEGNAFDIAPDDPAVIAENFVLHLVMVLMLERFGAIGLSETMQVTAAGPVSLTPFSRDLFVLDPKLA